MKKNTHRKYLLWITFLMGIFILSCDNADKLRPLQNQVFIKVYGGIKSEKGNSLAQLPDGGFILTGSTSSLSSGDDDTDVFIVRTDSVGNELWNRNFGRDGNDQANSVIVSRSGNSVIVCGESEEGFESVNRDIYIMEVDLLGN